jgi:hypothetical protein
MAELLSKGEKAPGSKSRSRYHEKWKEKAFSLAKLRASGKTARERGRCMGRGQSAKGLLGCVGSLDISLCTRATHRGFTLQKTPSDLVLRLSSFVLLVCFCSVV